MEATCKGHDGLVREKKQLVPFLWSNNSNGEVDKRECEKEVDKANSDRLLTYAFAKNLTLSFFIEINNIISLRVFYIKKKKILSTSFAVFT